MNEKERFIGGKGEASTGRYTGLIAFYVTKVIQQSGSF